MKQTELFQSLEGCFGGKVSSLRRYLADGTSCCALAGAGTFQIHFFDDSGLPSATGSFYLLILMAAAEIRPKIRLWGGDTCTRVSKLIRFPVNSGMF